MNAPIRKLVIVGGGTAGWMSAALLKRVLGDRLDIELVESKEIGTVGVGEATIPPIQHVNNVLGLDEAEFLRETKSTIKLAIRFENWRAQGEQYYHTFGAPGRVQAFCPFHHFWVRARHVGARDGPLGPRPQLPLRRKRQVRQIAGERPRLGAAVRLPFRRVVVRRSISAATARSSA